MALSNALARTRREGVETELLLTMANEPWGEIARVARDERVGCVILGLSDPAVLSKGGLEPILEALEADVAILHAEGAFDLAQVGRVLVPLSGQNDHDRLRARVIGSLARQGLQRLTLFAGAPT